MSSERSGLGGAPWGRFVSVEEVAQDRINNYGGV